MSLDRTVPGHNDTAAQSGAITLPDLRRVPSVDTHIHNGRSADVRLALIPGRGFIIECQRCGEEVHR